MAELTKTQAKEYARTLYLKDNLTQAEIAEKTGYSRQTINKWIKDGKWEELRSAFTLTREYQIEQLYRQVNALNSAISNRPENERFPDNTEADSLAKLASAIKKLEVDAGISDIISVGQRFIKYVRSIDLDRAKEITTVCLLYLKSAASFSIPPGGRIMIPMLCDLFVFIFYLSL